MSVRNLIDRICEERDCSYKELAEMIDIDYSVLLGYINNKVRLVTNKTSSNLSKALGISEIEVAYCSIVEERLPNWVTENVLFFLMEKHIQNYGVEIGFRSRNIYSSLYPDFRYGGAFYKKRTINTYSIVEDWEYLKQEFHKTMQPYLQDISEQREVFALKDKLYLSLILYFGIQRIQSIDDCKIRSYILLCSDLGQANLIKKLLPTNPGIPIAVEYCKVPEKLQMDNYRYCTDDQIKKFEYFTENVVMDKNRNKKIELIISILQAVIYQVNYLNKKELMTIFEYPSLSGGLEKNNVEDESELRCSIIDSLNRLIVDVKNESQIEFEIYDVLLFIGGKMKRMTINEVNGLFDLINFNF